MRGGDRMIEEERGERDKDRGDKREEKRWGDMMREVERRGGERRR